MKNESVLDIIKTTKDAHPKDCIFIDDAIDFIYEKSISAISKEDFLDKCQSAFKEAEIYCPHEGVDKRK